MFRRFISIILALTVILFCFGAVNALSENDQQSRFVLNQNNAYDKFKIIKEHYQNKYGKENPDNYAGAYLDAEGNLNINLVEGSSVSGDSEESLNTLINDESVKYHKVKYSFDHLNSIMNNLNGKMADLNIAAMERDDQNNKVTIYINNLDDNKVAKIKKLVDSPAIDFRPQVNNITLTATDIYNGNKYTTPSGSGTIGFGATKTDGTKGYVISGHIPDAEGANVKYSGTKIGSISEKVFGGSVDAAFVTKSGTTYQPSRTFFDYTSYNGNVAAMYTYLQGTAIHFWGSSSGKQTGNILSSSYSFEVNGVTLTDMVKSSYRAIGGDSGGPVCIPGTNQYNYLLAGTQCASSLNNKGKWVDNSFSIFCKINNILSELECTSNP